MSSLVSYVVRGSYCVSVMMAGPGVPYLDIKMFIILLLPAVKTSQPDFPFSQ